MAKKKLFNRRRTAAEKKYKDTLLQRKSLYGLKNQGATCYLNSVLQVLFMTIELRDRLEKTLTIKLKTDRALREMFEKLKISASETKNITNCFHITDVFQQRDASECLEIILNNISREFSGVFRGVLKYTTTCSEGHSINIETDPFWTLPLSLTDIDGSRYSVEKGIEMVFETTTFNGENMVYCDDCKKKTEATSGCEMVGFPQILILLLKRFDFDYITMSHFKTNCSVDIPSTLRMKNKQYRLYAIINHTGSLRSGHYTATILSNEDNMWYEFNDSCVYRVGEQQLDRTKSRISNTAYLLFYRGEKVKADRAPEKKGNPKTDGEKRNEALQKKNEDKPNCNRGKAHTVIEIPDKYEGTHLDDGMKPSKKLMKRKNKGYGEGCPNTGITPGILKNLRVFLCGFLYTFMVALLIVIIYNGSI